MASLAVALSHPPPPPPPSCNFVSSWLCSLGYQQYENIFIENGYCTDNEIQCMVKEDFVAMGVKPGHVNVLAMAVQKLWSSSESGEYDRSGFLELDDVDVSIRSQADFPEYNSSDVEEDDDDTSLRSLSDFPEYDSRDVEAKIPDRSVLPRGFKRKSLDPPIDYYYTTGILSTFFGTYFSLGFYLLSYPAYAWGFRITWFWSKYSIILQILLSGAYVLCTGYVFFDWREKYLEFHHGTKKYKFTTKHFLLRCLCKREQTGDLNDVVKVYCTSVDFDSCRRSSHIATRNNVQRPQEFFITSWDIREQWNNYIDAFNNEYHHYRTVENTADTKGRYAFENFPFAAE